MRRYLLATVFSLYAVQGFAATAQDWQSQLQRNLSAITGSSNVTVSGPINVTGSGTLYKADFPIINAKNADGTTWVIKGLTATRAATGDAVTITLPNMINRNDASGASVGAVMIGGHNLTGTWNDKTARFDALSGQLKNINIQQNENSTKANIATVDIKTPTKSSMAIGLTGLQGSSVVEQKAHSVQVGHLDYTYDFKGAQGLGLEQIIGLVQQNYLALSKTPVAMTAHGTNIAYQQGEKASTTIQDIKAEVMVTPKGDGKNADLRNHIDVNGITRTPAAISSLMMPKHLEMTGTVASLPLALLSMSPSNNTQTMKQEMADAKTIVNFDNIRMDTAQGAKMTGNGRLTANATTPTGFVGRLLFKMENLTNVMTNLQKQMAQPGATMATQGQAMMGMMMLQGLGTQNNKTTQYALDLTPDGQTLVNGQDISGLVNMGLGVKAKPATTGATPEGRFMEPSDLLPAGSGQ